MTTAPSPPVGRPRIRRASRADLLEVYRIERDAFPPPWPFEAFERYLGESGFLVADDGAIAGYVVADTVTGHGGRRVGHIKDLAVRRDRRREGLGSRLLERAVGVLASTPADAVKLEVRESNGPAIDLYRRHGFVYRRTLPAYYADGEDALVLVRPL